MSTIPSRTRSLRKPADTLNRNGRIPTADTGAASLERKPSISQRTSQSPSRLPVKPPRTTTTTTTRPPSSTGSTVSNSSMRPPPSRISISKPTPNTGLQRSTSTRRATESTSMDPVKQDRSRPPITQSKHTRNISANTFPTNARAQTHTRTRSSSTLLNNIPGPSSLRPPSRDGTQASKPPESQVQNPQLKRPAFSTLQQHFSPAKNLAPKPHPAAFLAPPSPSKLPSNIAISAETAKLQNELLQLHLLHKNASAVVTEWKGSARTKLESRFQDVVERNERLVLLEVQESSKINAVALKQWNDSGIPGWGLEEKIQILDEVITGVWNLSDSGGKYTRVVRKFEKWLVRSQAILSARERASHGDEEVMFLEELDGNWKDDCQLLSRKVDGWNAQLKDLGPSPDTKGSSLIAVIEGVRRLVKGMVMELNVMIGIQSDLLAREEEWIRKMNDGVMSDDDESQRHTAGAIWRNQ